MLVLEDPLKGIEALMGGKMGIWYISGFSAQQTQDEDVNKHMTIEDWN